MLGLTGLTEFGLVPNLSDRLDSGSLQHSPQAVHSQVKSTQNHAVLSLNSFRKRKVPWV